MYYKNEHPFGNGANPSKLDVRDHKDDQALVAPYPTSHTTQLSPLVVRMQYKIGKCVAESVTKQLEYLYYKKTGEYVQLSDDFLYFITKKFIDGNSDEGTSMRSVLKAVQKYGTCKKSTFSVEVGDSMSYADYWSHSTTLTQAMYDEALNYKGGQYLAIPLDEEMIKAAIYAYDMLVARFEVGKEWWTPSWNAKDILPLKPPVDVISGHANILYAYDDTLIYNGNSWSDLWALQGNGNFNFKTYAPHLTEVWALTLSPVVVDNSPVLSADVVSKFVRLLRWLKLIR
jgi:hypothetical protein